MITGLNKKNMNYIERNPEKSFGMPSLIGRRLTVFDIVTQISGEGLELAMEDYEINQQQVQAALIYCSELGCKIDSEKFQFCDGCILRKIADGDVFDRNDYDEITYADGTKATVSKIDNVIFLGSLEELEMESVGLETWEIAESLLSKYF